MRRMHYGTMTTPMIDSVVSCDLRSVVADEIVRGVDLWVSHETLPFVATRAFSLRLHATHGPRRTLLEHCRCDLSGALTNPGADLSCVSPASTSASRILGI